MVAVSYQAVQYVGEEKVSQSDLLTEEEPLYIHVNGKPFTITMRTPGNDKELIRGILNSEDICKPNSSSLIIDYNEFEKKGVTYNVSIAAEDVREGYKNSRNLLSVSSCGICGQTELSEVEGRVLSNESVSSFELEHMFSAMKSHQKLFNETGGCHAAAAFDKEGKLLSVMEDIGRHNAVDKVIGSLLLNNKIKLVNVLLVSGRISYEIVVKAFRAKIPILAAVSAPSSLAVDYAKELGITLFGFCRENKATCYANLNRVSENKI